MRLVVLYDLPVKSKAERKAYGRFHKFLLKDGYDMIQFSVYARICNGLDAVSKHVGRLQLNKPMAGQVRYFQMTEKQFIEMKLLVGAKTEKESARFTDQLTLF